MNGNGIAINKSQVRVQVAALRSHGCASVSKPTANCSVYKIGFSCGCSYRVFVKLLLPTSGMNGIPDAQNSMQARLTAIRMIRLKFVKKQRKTKNTLI